jgi:hypothetical protein
MPATVATLKTYLGLSGAAAVDDQAMAAACAASNDLVTQLRPDLTVERVDTARWVYDGTTIGVDPGAGKLRVAAWGGTSDWAVSETDADGVAHEFDALADGVYELRLAPDGPLTARFVVQGPTTDQGVWWSWSARLDAGTVTAPTVGTSLYFRGPTTFGVWAERADQAALVEAARLYGRRGSVQGVAAFADIGVSLLPRLDPEVRSLLELGEYQKPVVA